MGVRKMNPVTITAFTIIIKSAQYKNLATPFVGKQRNSRVRYGTTKRVTATQNHDSELAKNGSCVIEKHF